MVLSSRYDRMRASVNPARDPCRILERVHGFAEIGARGVAVFVVRLRVNPPHLEREFMTLSKDALRHGYRVAHQCLGFFEVLQIVKGRRVVERCLEGI